MAKFAPQFFFIVPFGNRIKPILFLTRSRANLLIMDEPILAEKDAKTEQKGESERDVLEGDAERPKKQAKLMESSSADSAIVHQLSEPNAEKDESNGNVETEKKDKNGKESFPRGRTVISFGYLGAGYQGLQLYAIEEFPL